MQKLPWQEKLIAETSETTALLVIGDVEMGTQHLALALAERFVELPPSLGWSDAGIADVMVVSPEKNVIKVEVVRNAIEFLSYAPIAGKKRIVVFLQAETLNLSAANALLKTLEDMATNKMIILSAQSSRQLPATIVSRSHIVRPPYLSPAQAREWFTGEDDCVFNYHGRKPLVPTTVSKVWVETLADIFSAGIRLDVVDGYSRIKEQSSTLGMEPHDWLLGLQKWIADIILCTFKVEPCFFPHYQKRLSELGQGREKVFLDFYQLLLSRRAWMQHPLVHDVYVRNILYTYRETCAH